MNIDQLTTLLGWCGLINLSLLLIWFLFISLAHDWVFHLHSRWYKLKVEDFDVIHYKTIGYYKLATFFFNFAPYLVLRFIL